MLTEEDASDASYEALDETTVASAGRVTEAGHN
jgi:hypothetical protein